MSNEKQIKPATHRYQTDFSLVASVNDYDEAKAFLDESSKGMAEITQGHIRYKTEDASFADKITDVKWVLDDNLNGHINIDTNAPLTDSEKTFLSDYLVGQNADGIGESFEQQPFANYEDDEYCYEEDDEPDYVMASFDWETNEYLLREVPLTHDLSLSEADLDFANESEMQL